MYWVGLIGARVVCALECAVDTCRTIMQLLKGASRLDVGVGLVEGSVERAKVDIGLL